MNKHCDFFATGFIFQEGRFKNGGDKYSNTVAQCFPTGVQRVIQNCY